MTGSTPPVKLGSKKAKKAAAREAAYALIGGKEAAADKATVGKYRRVGST